MFTGLIEEIGRVFAFETGDRGTRLGIAAPRLSVGIHLGDSIAVNGCCLSVTAAQGGELHFDLLEETIARTNLAGLRRGDRVNLERPLALGGRLDGHLVQGHVDCAARVLTSSEKGADQRIEVALPAEFAHYVVSKGSIAVNGVSLTVGEMLPESFAVWIIPHTRAETNLGAARAGDLVNLEFDLIAKYLERMLDRKTHGPA
jgi:riboflavin synthase